MITIEGWDIDRAKNIHGVKATRIYESREAVDLAGGGRLAPLDSWQLRCEVLWLEKGHRVQMENFQLEPTDSKEGPQLYIGVIVDGEGCVWWNKAEEFELPAHLGPTISYTKLLLWNLERQGVIAPGQLDD